MPRPCQGRPPCCSQPSWAPVQGDRPVARGALGKALLSPTVPRSLALALAATVRTATRAACRPERCRHTAWRPGGAGAASRPWRQRITAIASGDGRWRSAPRPSPPHPGDTGAPADQPPPLWPPARPASAYRPRAGYGPWHRRLPRTLLVTMAALPCEEGAPPIGGHCALMVAGSQGSAPVRKRSYSCGRPSLWPLVSSARDARVHIQTIVSRRSQSSRNPLIAPDRRLLACHEGRDWRGAMLQHPPAPLLANPPGADSTSRASHLCVSLVAHAASDFAGSADTLHEQCSRPPSLRPRLSRLALRITGGAGWAGPLGHRAHRLLSARPGPGHQGSAD